MSRPCLIALLLLGTLLFAAPVWAQPLSYTVQVVAVTDQDAALEVQTSLLDQAFPAYVVRAATPQGDIYRVRVGAFANRGAAHEFAQAMPVISGSDPLPALAEGIPLGVVPLEPRILAVFHDDVEVLEWRSGTAFRSRATAAEGEEAQPFHYVIVEGDEVTQFEAYAAFPLEGGMNLVVQRLPLWPPEWEQREPDELHSLARDLLEELALQLDLTIDRLQEFVAEGEPPYLVVLERTGSLRPEVVGVYPPDADPDGLREPAHAYVELPAPAQPLYRASTGSEPVSTAGDGWSVQRDGRFFRFMTNGGGSAWRVGVGTPLWATGELLLTRSSGRFLLYELKLEAGE